MICWRWCNALAVSLATKYWQMATASSNDVAMLPSDVLKWPSWVMPRWLCCGVVQSILVSLRRGATTPGFFTANNIGSDQKSGKPGFADLSLMKLLLLRFLEVFVGGITNDATKKEFQDVMSCFQSPMLFDSKFVKAGEAEDGDGQTICPMQSFLASLQKPSSHNLCNILHGVFDGEYDEDLLNLLTQDKPHMLLADEGKAKEAGVADLGILQNLASWMKEAENSTKVVSAAAGVQEAAPLRMLIRRASGEGDEQRAAAAVERKSFGCQNINALSSALGKSGNKPAQPARSWCSSTNGRDASQAQNIANGRPFVPNPGEAHRLFVLSVDLIQEAEHKPWAQTLEKAPAGAHKAEGKAGWVLTCSVGCRLQFINQQNGPADICAAFDGRSRAGRTWLEQKFDAGKAVECWLLYDGKQQYRFRTRQVIYGSKMGETSFIHFSFNRTKVPLTSTGNRTDLKTAV